MYCGYCGSPLKGKEKFCPRCGRELPKAQAAKQKTHSRRKAPVIAAVVLLAAAGAGFLSWKFLWGEPARIQREAAKRYELCMEIHQQVDKIIAPYLEGEESFEYDEEILTQAAEDVYAYAQTLEEQGTIEGSAMCREGFSVSFFLRDGSTSVYLPPIKDYYAGGEDQDLRIGVVDMLSWLKLTEQAGYENPGDTIKEAIPETQTEEFGDDTTVTELKEILGSLDQKNFRGLFWRGHGGLYTESDGDTIACFVLGEKITRKKEAEYSQDRKKKEGSIGAVCASGDQFAINYQFFEKYMSQVSGGMFFTSACWGLGDNGTLAMTLIEKGMEAYAGANGPVNILYANEILSQTAKNLVQKAEDGTYMDLETALNQAVEKYEDSLGEAFNQLPWNQGEFYAVLDEPFYLIPPSQEEDTVQEKEDDVTAFAEIVEQYEEKYGQLQFYPQSYVTNYTGVFLLDLVDFDQDGTQELVIGYSVPHPQGIQNCAWPALDVWKLEDGSPVCVYEECYVQQSDIGRHCLYTSVDGVWYLVTGWSGSDQDLELLKLQGDGFGEGMHLQSKELMEEGSAVVYGMGYYLNGAQIQEEEFQKLTDQIYSARSYSGSLYSDQGYTRENLIAYLNQTRTLLGMEEISEDS